jgi:hypothetical protein
VRQLFVGFVNGSSRLKLSEKSSDWPFFYFMSIKYMHWEDYAGIKVQDFGVGVITELKNIDSLENLSDFI